MERPGSDSVSHLSSSRAKLLRGRSAADGVVEEVGGWNRWWGGGG